MTSVLHNRTRITEDPRSEEEHTPAALAHFLRSPWMVREVYKHLPLLKDVLAWQCSSHWTLPVGRSVVTHRFTHIVRPFIGDQIPALCSVMHDWGAVITGSCALEMLTGKHIPTDNLNFVVPNGSFDMVEQFILRSRRYKRINTTSSPHQAFCSVVQTFAKYRGGGMRITLSEAVSEDIYDVITSSPTSGDMIFMTPGGVVSFYPELTSDMITIFNGSLGRRSLNSYVGCLKHARYQTYNDTSFLQRPCETDCPALWRNIADGGPGGLVIEWDSRYSLRTSLARSQASWRLADRCRNVVCRMNCVNNARQPLLPPIPAPADRMAMREQEARMRHYVPRDARMYTGVLYATRACAPELVPIPLRDGITQLTHINDLEVLHWVNCLGDNRFAVDMSRARKTYNVITHPLSPAYGYAYTFYREHPEIFAPPNGLIGTVTAGITKNNSVLGNVLVVKHTKGKKHDIVADDVESINHIFKMTVTQAEFWT